MTLAEYTTRIQALTDAEFARVAIASGILDSPNLTEEDRAWFLSKSEEDTPNS